MQGFEITEYFEKLPFLRKYFVGIFSINTIPKIIKKNSFLICNTDTSNGIGKHWICFTKVSTDCIECFDSLGINEEKKQLLKSYCDFKNVSKIQFNETQFQDNGSSTCGLFAIYFAVQRFYNLDLHFDELLEEIFVNETEKNELIVKEFLEDLFQD
jgi:hypothetical protein